MRTGDATSDGKQLVESKRMRIEAYHVYLEAFEVLMDKLLIDVEENFVFVEMMPAIRETNSIKWRCRGRRETIRVIQTQFHSPETRTYVRMALSYDRLRQPRPLSKSRGC